MNPFLSQSLGPWGTMADAPQLQGTFGNFAALPGGGGGWSPMAGWAADTASRFPGLMGGGRRPGMGGGFGGGGGMQALLGQFQAAQGQAQAANRARYKQALGLHDNVIANLQAGNQRTDQMLRQARGRGVDRAEQMGADERMAIADRYKVLGAQQNQDMVSRGLGNTTLQQANQRGLQRSQDRALLNQQQAELRNIQDVDLGLSKDLASNQRSYDLHRNPILDKIGTIASRTDSGPDMSQLYQLMYGLGRSRG